MDVIMIYGDNCKWWLMVMTIDFGDFDSVRIVFGLIMDVADGRWWWLWW